MALAKVKRTLLASGKIVRFGFIAFYDSRYNREGLPDELSAF